jgi:hypothetical protein
MKTFKKTRTKWVRYKYPSRPDAFEAFSAWLAYPRKYRNPKTQGELAIKLEVSPNTLSFYKKKPEFWKRVEEQKFQLASDAVDAKLLAQANFDYERYVEDTD